MNVVIGSARIDEHNEISGGSAGDQKQTGKTDYTGEVSLQNFYVASKGWYILRPKSSQYATKIAERMLTACNNINIGYDQSGRLGIIKNGINATSKTEADCSSLVRACVKEATGKDPGNFTTSNEATMLEATGLFEKRKKYSAGTNLLTGDVLVTCTKGHTVIVVDGENRPDAPTGGIVKIAAARSKSSSYNKTYKTTTGLNLRNAPGVDDTVVLVTIPVGKSFRCYGYYTKINGTAWLYGIYTDNSGKQYTGFASSKYLK
jgi:cell wall-associated NlpC family hydrolase